MSKAQQDFSTVANTHLLLPFSLPPVCISVLTDARLIPAFTWISSCCYYE